MKKTMKVELGRCAVCGDSTPLNVRNKWRRDSDGQVFSVCMYCREQDLANSESVENFGYVELNEKEKAEWEYMSPVLNQPKPTPVRSHLIHHRNFPRNEIKEILKAYRTAHNIQ